MGASGYKQLTNAPASAQAAYEETRRAVEAALDATWPDPKVPPVDAVIAALTHIIGTIVKAAPPERRAIYHDYAIECVNHAVRLGVH